MSSQCDTESADRAQQGQGAQKCPGQGSGSQLEETRDRLVWACSGRQEVPPGAGRSCVLPALCCTHFLLYKRQPQTLSWSPVCQLWGRLTVRVPRQLGQQAGSKMGWRRTHMTYTFPTTCCVPSAPLRCHQLTGREPRGPGPAVRSPGPVRSSACSPLLADF